MTRVRIALPVAVHAVIHCRRNTGGREDGFHADGRLHRRIVVGQSAANCAPQFGAGDINPIEAEELGEFRDSLVPAGLSVSTQITLAILVAAVVDVILIWSLL